MIRNMLIAFPLAAFFVSLIIFTIDGAHHHSGEQLGAHRHNKPHAVTAAPRRRSMLSDVPATAIDKLPAAARPAHKNALIIVGPSASGKTTLTRRLLADLGPHATRKLVRHTTRPPRPNEHNNTDYTFVTAQCVHSGVASGKFVIISELCDNVYGISDENLRSCIGGTAASSSPPTTITSSSSSSSKKSKHKNKRGGGATTHSSSSSSGNSICVTEMIVSAMVLDALRLVEEMLPVIVYIRPPNIAQLEQRLRGRNTESTEALLARVHRAHDDMMFCHRKRHLVDYCLTNNDLNTTYRRLTEIVRTEFSHILPPPALPISTTLPYKTVSNNFKNSTKVRLATTETEYASRITMIIVQPTPVRYIPETATAVKPSKTKIKAIYNVNLWLPDSYF